jgi:hypothetical protein
MASSLFPASGSDPDSSGGNVDGDGYGLIGPGNAAGNDNINLAKNKGHSPLIWNPTGNTEVIFKISGFGSIDAADIEAVTFLYQSTGVAVTGIDPVPTPEPASWAIWGVVALAGMRYGRRRKAALFVDLG